MATEILSPAQAISNGRAARLKVDQHEDVALIQAAKGGDARAFEILVRRYEARTYGTVMRLVRDPDDAADITQEVFMRAWRGIGNFRNDSALFTWLHRIAVNTVRNFMRSATRRQDRTGLEEARLAGEERFADTTRDRPDQALEYKLLQETLATALQKLPDEQREALLFRERAGLSYDEISRRQGCPVGTVRSRIFRARNSLLAVLKSK